MSVKLPVTGHYTAKDQLKANVANKFIGRGSPASSTDKYRQAYGEQANSSKYVKSDIVFVSVEGARRNRLALNQAEVMVAIAAGVTFVADNAANRARPYNVGERELATLLTANNYQVTEYIEGAAWTPIK